MKILMIVPDLVIGGVTTVVLNIINGLKKRNIQVKLVSLFDHCEMDIENIDYQTLGLQSIFDIPKSIIQMRKIIDSFKPDLVHSHTMYSNLLILACSLKNKTYKLIVSDHGTYTSNLRFYKRMYLFKILNPLADIVTNVSNASCESYIKQHIVEPQRMRTMYNGVDLKKFKSIHFAKVKLKKQLKIDERKKVIGFVGRLSKEKNLPNLINAVSLLEMDYVLIIIGNGPEKGSLEELIESKGLKEKINFLGEIKDPSRYYSIFDVLVLSSDTEGLPTVILEAIASKCPVISTDCGGVKEIFPVPYDYLVPCKDTNKLSERINNLLNLDLISINKIVELNYDNVCEKFLLDDTAMHWLKLYKEVVNAPK